MAALRRLLATTPLPPSSRLGVWALASLPSLFPPPHTSTTSCTCTTTTSTSTHTITPLPPGLGSLLPLATFAKKSKSKTSATSPAPPPSSSPTTSTSDNDVEIDAAFWKDAQSAFESPLTHLSSTYVTLRSARASPSTLDGIAVDAYGTKQPLHNLAHVSVKAPLLLTVTPFDATIKKDVIAALMASPLEVTAEELPSGEVLVRLPVATREGQKAMVAVAKQHADHARGVVRHERMRVRAVLKKAGLTKDEMRAEEERVQEMHDVHVKKIEEMLARKERELMEL